MKKINKLILIVMIVFAFAFSYAKDCDASTQTKKSAPSVFVTGEVLYSDEYTFSCEKKMTLARLICLSGYTRLANLSSVKIRRETDGKTEIIEVNLKKILNSPIPDFQLKDGDIVIVGESIF